MKPDPITIIWLTEQFNKLHHEHALILKRIEELKPKVTFISPALECAVNAVSTQAIKIDRQVPDITFSTLQTGKIQPNERTT